MNQVPPEHRECYDRILAACHIDDPEREQHALRVLEMVIASRRVHAAIESSSGSPVGRSPGGPH